MYPASSSSTRLLLQIRLGDRGPCRIRGGVPVPVPVFVRGSLRRRDELGEHAREHVDLVATKLGERRDARPGSCVSTRSSPSMSP